MLDGFLDITESECVSVRIASNFHTHNYLCGHAGGTVADYVREAVARGMQTIGISDHCIAPVGSYEPYFTPETMRELYLPQFDEARKLYGDRIEIAAGAEIEYFDGCDSYYRELLKDLDYLVLGQHEYMHGGRRRNSFCDGVGEDNIVAYFESVQAGIKSGYFAFVAHPDLIFYRRPNITDAIVDAFDKTVRTAVECGVPLELNANGIRSHGFRYPTDMLVDLCEKHGAKVIVSSDSHSPDALCDAYMRRLYAYAIKRGLNVVDRIVYGGSSRGRAQ